MLISNFYSDFSGDKISTDLGETEEGIILAAAVAGTKKPVPEENSSEDCKSCGAKITQIYCGNCGQKNDDLRRSLWRLIWESLGGIFSFEGRMWRTWADLLSKPGKVAREYANGARTTYSAPIRVYIVISFLFFAIIALSNTNFLSFEVVPTQTEQADQVPSQSQLLGGQKIGNEVIATPYSTPKASKPGDSKPGNSRDEQTQALSQSYIFNLYVFKANDKLYKMNDQEMEEFTRLIQGDEDIKVQIKNDNIDTKKVLNTLLTNQQKFNGTFNTWLPRAMFFMVPFAMLFGWLFIRGKNALLYDHLIHALYIHCVFFLALIMSLLLARIAPGFIVFLGLFGFMVVHLLISLKRMFSRSWFKTVLTTIGTGFLYSMLLLIILVSISAYSIVQAVVDAGLIT